jgi:hypothetical protein
VLKGIFLGGAAFQLALARRAMGKGLSPLQKDVLAVLEEIPALKDQPPGSLKFWASPKQNLLPCTAHPPHRTGQDASST